MVGQLGAGSGTCVEAITLRSGLGCQLLETGPCQHGGRRTVKRGLQRNQGVVEKVFDNMKSTEDLGKIEKRI